MEKKCIAPWNPAVKFAICYLNAIIYRVTELVTSKLGEHGFGLRRIDKIVEHYDGYVNRKNEPGVFATEVLLPL